MRSIVWNIENMKRNLFSLKNYLHIHTPDLVFLSEPMMFQCDFLNIMEYFKGEYCASLNSEDLHNPELPLISSRAKGGTLVMWRSSLDPFITTHITDTSSFLPIIIELPNSRVSIHIALYLPTAGQDSQFIADLSKLRSTLDDLVIKYANPVVFLRGDANSSQKNIFRRTLLTSFTKDYNLTRASVNHMTYHHFIGEGKFDSDLDVLLFSSLPGVHEGLDHIHCKLDEPNVDSCHDILVSTASMPLQQLKPVDKSEKLLHQGLKIQDIKLFGPRMGFSTTSKLSHNYFLVYVLGGKVAQVLHYLSSFKLQTFCSPWQHLKIIERSHYHQPHHQVDQ